jgi:hypothetical protein
MTESSFRKDFDGRKSTNHRCYEYMGILGMLLKQFQVRS